jgi:hypothetical protein
LWPFFLETSIILFHHNFFPAIIKHHSLVFKFSSFYISQTLFFELSKSFAVQCQSDHGFSAVSCDQTIEQTINRDSKTKGGLVGFSLNHAAIHRWLLAQSERAAITNKCKDMAGTDAKAR